MSPAERSSSAKVCRSSEYSCFVTQAKYLLIAPCSTEHLQHCKLLKRSRLRRCNVGEREISGGVIVRTRTPGSEPNDQRIGPTAAVQICRRLQIPRNLPLSKPRRAKQKAAARNGQHQSAAGGRRSRASWRTLRHNWRDVPAVAALLANPLAGSPSCAADSLFTPILSREFSGSCRGRNAKAIRLW